MGTNHLNASITIVIAAVHSKTLRPVLMVPLTSKPSNRRYNAIELMMNNMNADTEVPIARPFTPREGANKMLTQILTAGAGAGNERQQRFFQRIEYLCINTVNSRKQDAAGVIHKCL